MPNKPPLKSDAFSAIHSSATALHKVGAINQITMREFNTLCIKTPSTLAPEEIKNIRENAHVSQPVFAHYLNTTVSTVQKWETGNKRPSGMALKLLDIIQKHGFQVLA